MAATQQPSRQQTLDLLRFPLALVVMTIHIWSPNGFLLHGETVDLQGFPLFQEVNCWIDGFLRGQSVPIYFFISGFVFFSGVEWNRETYLRKLKNRVKTLLIPYLIWNTAAIGLLAVKYLPFFEGFRSVETEFQFSFKALLACFWNYRSDFYPGLYDASVFSGPAEALPVNGALWFLRDLMIVVVCTPLLHRLLKRAGIRAVIGLGTLWFIAGYRGPSHLCQLLDAFFFFAWGAYLSINRKEMLAEFGRYFTFSMWAYPLLALSYVAAMHLCPEAAFTIKRVNILVGLLFAYNAASRLLRHDVCKPSAFLAASSFFIYAAHYPLCDRLCRILLVLFRPESDIALLAVYTLTTLLLTALLLSAFYLMKRCSPRLLKIVAGRRQNESSPTRPGRI